MLLLMRSVDWGGNFSCPQQRPNIHLLPMQHRRFKRIARRERAKFGKTAVAPHSADYIIQTLQTCHALQGIQLFTSF